MTTDLLPPPTTAPVGTSASPTGPAIWRRARWFLLGGLVLLLTGLLVGGLAQNGQWPPGDPRSTDPDGARAIVHLLQKQGVSVDITADTTDLSDALHRPDTTVVLPDPELLGSAELTRLSDLGRASANRLVLIAPQAETLDAFAPGIRPTTAFPESQATAPFCDLPEAQRAGTAELGGSLYHPGPGDQACYQLRGLPSLVRHTEGVDRETVVLGTADFLTNQRLTTEGNASLALGLLGAHPHVVWFLTSDSSPAPDDRATKSFLDYVPGGWHWATLQLALAALLAAFWRGRRLGPVVSEELPVVVRATETTEGRARLYQRAEARGSAAESLRRAVRNRLAPVLGLPLSAGEPDPTALSAAVAARLDRPAADVWALLYGPSPSDDAALLRLTDDLDALERQVRQP